MENLCQNIIIWANELWTVGVGGQGQSGGYLWGYLPTQFKSELCLLSCYILPLFSMREDAALSVCFAFWLSCPGCSVRLSYMPGTHCICHKYTCPSCHFLRLNHQDNRQNNGNC